MSKLNSSNRTVAVNYLDYSRQHFNVSILPDSQILRRNSSFRLDCRCFRHHQPCPSYGSTDEMNQMPIIREPINTGILTHGRNCNAISEANATLIEGLK